MRASPHRLRPRRRDPQASWRATSSDPQRAQRHCGSSRSARWKGLHRVIIFAGGASDGRHSTAVERSPPPTPRAPPRGAGSAVPPRPPPAGPPRDRIHRFSLTASPSRPGPEQPFAGIHWHIVRCCPNLLFRPAVVAPASCRMLAWVRSLRIGWNWSCRESSGAAARLIEHVGRRPRRLDCALPCPNLRAEPLSSDVNRMAAGSSRMKLTSDGRPRAIHKPAPERLPRLRP